MEKIILTKEQVIDLVFHNKYKIDEKEKLTNINELPVIVSAGENYGFEIDQEKTVKIVKKIVGRTKVNQNEFFSGAILQVRGNYSIPSMFSFTMMEENLQGKLFIFHATIADKTHRIIAKKLIEEEAVKLFPGTDEEYLYEILSEATEDYLFETLKKLVKGLPIFLVDFKEDGSFKVEEMGEIS